MAEKKKRRSGLVTDDPEELRELTTAALAIHHMMLMKRLEREKATETSPGKKEPLRSTPGGKVGAELLEGDKEEEENIAAEILKKKKPGSISHGKDDELDGSEDEEGEETPKNKIPGSISDGEDQPDQFGESGEGAAETPKKKKPKSRLEEKDEEFEDSEETLQFLCGYNPPELPPAVVVSGEEVGNCSRPFWKQLTASDVDGEQSRLTMEKLVVEKALSHLLEQDSDERPGRIGTWVTVCGPGLRVYRMKFKRWAEGFYALTSTHWTRFCTDYGLQKHSYFVTIWMFRHNVTGRIAFAILPQRFHVDKTLSSRIVKAVFKN